MKLKQLMTALLLTLMAVNAQAVSECQFGVSHIFTNYKDHGRITVSLINAAGETGRTINKDNLTTTEANLNRFYSTAMTALTLNKQLVVRYPEDGLVCSTLSGPRNDFLGMWILK